MTDSRCTKLAELLVNYSTCLQAGEHILIEAFDMPREMVIELVKVASIAGGYPHVAIRDAQIMRALHDDASDAQFEIWSEYDLERMKRMDAYLGMRGSHNVSEMSGLDSERQQAWGRIYGTPVHMKQRLNHTRWCVLRWPTPAMAQLAGMNTSAFEDFYFDVCTLDYSLMAEAANKLVESMENTDQVHIEGPGETDLRFSIKDIPAIPCCGKLNIPDGEVFTAPVKDSVNGIIHYNTPSIYRGHSFENIRLEFKDGKVVGCSADQGGEFLEDIFESDEGARYVGEFAIGFNPYIKEAMKDILFDEKIAGSMHFTPGNSYDDACNGNKSEVHWDLVLIQRSEYGGGTISFDGDVIRKDGMFVKDSLLGLNPENLIGECCTV
ncbi:MAG: aminopeptidase [Phycisphaerales bacterium]|jgi:aminopeptidase|nr:aminopeptidase [Phycisphaerales bacterium]